MGSNTPKDRRLKVHRCR